MPFQDIKPGDDVALEAVAQFLQKARKIVAITGAGISTSAGIPVRRMRRVLEFQYSMAGVVQSDQQWANINGITQDFRSQAGLYDLIENAAAGSSMKGKDMFSSNMWKDKDTTTTFLKFIANLRRKTIEDIKDTTSTHKFIRALRDSGRLVRNYTQNIDGLEAREGLVTDLSRGKGHRSRFTARVVASAVPEPVEIGSEFDGGCECVQLHGDLQTLRCSICAKVHPWTDDLTSDLDAGIAPPCQQCKSKNDDREEKGRRTLPAGLLVPNIVLYGEDHPQSHSLGPISEADIRLRPDALIIMGTSLKVHGLKILVRELSRSIHTKKYGKVIFINNTRPSESVWGDIIDYWVQQDCDSWVDDLKARSPNIWSRAVETLDSAMLGDGGDTDGMTDSQPSLPMNDSVSGASQESDYLNPGSQASTGTSGSESRSQLTSTPPTSRASSSPDYRMSIAFVLCRSPGKPRRARRHFRDYTSPRRWLSDDESSPSLSIPSSPLDRIVKTEPSNVTKNKKKRASKRTVRAKKVTVMA